MIAVMKRKKEPINYTAKPKDIIIQRSRVELVENEKGRLELVKKSESVNITRMVNETKKLIKTESAAEKLAEIQKVFSK